MVSLGSGIFAFSGKLKLKFCINAVATRNITFRANVSPAHKRLPAPNGNDLSSFTENCPFESKNRSGLNSSGFSHTDGSSLFAVSDANTIEPFSDEIDIHKNVSKNILNGIYLWNIVSHEFGVTKCRVRQSGRN